MTNRTQPPITDEQATKVEFKDAYYGIGDKIEALEEIKNHIHIPRQRRQLDLMISEFRNLESRLREWGNETLKNWD